MKKLLSKDKNFRFILKAINKKYFVFKSIIKNKQLFILIRYKAYLKLKKLVKLYSTISILNRCIKSVNKKSFNKFTLFSRFIFLKLLKNGKIVGFQKSSW